MRILHNVIAINVQHDLHNAFQTHPDQFNYYNGQTSLFNCRRLRPPTASDCSAWPRHTHLSLVNLFNFDYPWCLSFRLLLPLCSWRIVCIFCFLWFLLLGSSISLTISRLILLMILFLSLSFFGSFSFEGLLSWLPPGDKGARFCIFGRMLMLAHFFFMNGLSLPILYIFLPFFWLIFLHIFFALLIWSLRLRILTFLFSISLLLRIIILSVSLSLLFWLSLILSAVRHFIFIRITLLLVGFRGIGLGVVVILSLPFLNSLITFLVFIRFLWFWFRIIVL